MESCTESPFSDICLCGPELREWGPHVAWGLPGAGLAASTNGALEGEVVTPVFGL